MNQNYLYQAKSNFVLRKIAGTTVLVAVGAGVADFRGYIQMNPTAEKLWVTLKNKVSEEEIVDTLFEAFEVSREELSGDVHEILEMLVEKDMVIRYDI